ncbi:tRNA pseudouridine synthase 1 [Kickxella alabastrina]|uniref:tRNA pseudouridine synthase 1 n=1 Tax=Kickxella alabastrina TaxID=61397 RepID=A0ACC1IW06_9FUNG|nr:tRNA pseudouridine synthase 1 [Kickxella alabastrina]
MFGIRAAANRISTSTPAFRSFLLAHSLSTQTSAMPDTPISDSVSPQTEQQPISATEQPLGATEQPLTASEQPASATEQPAGATEQPDKKRSNRGQTCKDRREFAKKKRLIRNLEPKQEQRQPRAEGSEPRQPKRKVALLIGFCGTGYQGMQVNPNAKTIEGELFKALGAAGAVSADNADDQGKVQFQRAARTDKGVHAAGQVVSLKMIIEDPGIVAKLNANLPEQIRAWGFVRTIRSFNCKTMCDSRTYEYLLPTYVLEGADPELAEIARKVEFGLRRVPETSEEEMARKRAFRVTEDRLRFVREAFEKYVGTHEFRNFTVTKGCTDNNSKRFIHAFTVSDPMVIQGAEWLSLKVKGQSFMLHQIRKMVGLIILMARANAPLSLINALFAGPRVNVPKAPGLGLLLESPCFDAYNRRTAAQKDSASDPVTFEPYEAEIVAFKQKFIYDAIIRTEMEDRVFDSWVKSAEVFPEQYTYVNPEGVIPEDAIVTPETERIWQMKRKEQIAARAAAEDGEDIESSEDEQDSKDD